MDDLSSVGEFTVFAGSSVVVTCRTSVVGSCLGDKTGVIREGCVMDTAEPIGIGGVSGASVPDAVDCTLTLGSVGSPSCRVGLSSEVEISDGVLSCADNGFACG